MMKSRDTTHDALMGEGVYLTDLPPSTPNNILLKNNYGQASSRNKERVEVCFRFRSSDIMGYSRRRFGDRVIYLYPAEIDLTKTSCTVSKRESDSDSWEDWIPIATVGGILVVAGLAFLAWACGDDQTSKQKAKK